MPCHVCFLSEDRLLDQHNQSLSLERLCLLPSYLLVDFQHEVEDMESLEIFCNHDTVE